MKFLYALSLSIVVYSAANAQVANGSFENWYSDTATFSYGSFVPLDSFHYTAPVDWTCSNSITMSPGLGAVQLVDSSLTAYAGAKSLYLHTDTIVVAGVNLHLVLPGFAINGAFHLDLNSLTDSGTFSPVNFPGAGVPCTQRLQGFSFYMKYTPIPNDSCLMWAVLKHGSEVIADAKFSTTQAASNFTQVTRNFTYYSCTLPDTLIILFASSTPDFAAIASGSTGLSGGSQVWIDSVELIQGTVPPPVTQNVSTFTYENTARNVDVVIGDTDCSGLSLTISIAVNPLHGTATVNGQTIVYTPATGYTGKDTFVYSASNGTTSSSAYVYVNVFPNAALTEISDYIKISPNPAYGDIKIENESDYAFDVRMFDASGQSVKDFNLQGKTNTVNVGDMPSGVYLLKGYSADKQTIFIKKIAVVR